MNDTMRWLTASVLLGAAPWAAASCFLVYSPSGELVYRSVVSPVDLSVPLSRGLSARYPNHQLVMVNDESNCPDLGTGHETQQRTRIPDITSLLQPRSTDNAATAASDASMRAAGKSTGAARTAGAKPKP